MGSLIEINDTLKISEERGFPASELKIAQHVWMHYDTEKFKGRKFPFWNKGQRVYPDEETRAFLVQEMPDKLWLYWGHAIVLPQTRDNGVTRGEFEIVKVYDPIYQMLHTVNEAPEGKSFFEPDMLEWLLRGEPHRPLHRLQEYVVGRIERYKK